MDSLLYGIVGSGRLASHLIEYFQLLEIPFINWNRKSDNSEPEKKLEDCNIIILAVSDGAIDSLTSRFHDSGKCLVHLSGANSFSGIIGCHPLMTFPKELFSLEIYKQIPFVLDDDGPDWEDLFPSLENPHYRLEREKKALYHAWCVMAGNFSTLLWHKTLSVFEGELGLPGDVLRPYASKVANSFLLPGKENLTGPLVRGDSITIRKNKVALKESVWEDVYTSFEKAFNADEHFAGVRV